MRQHLSITGNVGKDAEMRYTPSGAAVTSFSVATNRQWNNQAGETIKETAWFRVSAWGKLAEVCNQYVKKGMKVQVEGRLTFDNATGGPRLWAGNDGAQRASFEVNASEVIFLSWVDGENEQPAPVASPATAASTASDAGDMLPPEDDIPF